MAGIRSVVANFGFLLQVTGLLLVLPIAIGVQNDELQAVASIMATCFISFGLGFILNSYCERKELDETNSLWLMIITFTILPLVLMIPYVWNNVFSSGNPFDLFTNSYFETVSGFTTTGFSFIVNAEALPRSLLFYRSLVEFIGGIGFVYLFVAFLYPNRSLGAFAEAFGVEKISENLRKVLLLVMFVYTFFVFVFTIVFYLVYSSDLVVASTTAIDILTGGYQPNITAGIGVFQMSIIVLMLLGSLNFRLYYNLLHLRLRTALTGEVKLYLGIIAGATILLAVLAWVNPFDSLFHVVSMMSSTGANYINLAMTPTAAKVAFVILMLIGGCTFSMAGGIRIQRIRLLLNAFRRKGDHPKREELKTVLTCIAIFIIILTLLALAFSTIGISILDSLFEVGSALTTNGISMGITTVTIPLPYKWLLILAMVLGRIEIISVFRALNSIPVFEAAKHLVFRLRREKPKSYKTR